LTVIVPLDTQWTLDPHMHQLPCQESPLFWSSNSSFKLWIRIACKFNKICYKQCGICLFVLSAWCKCSLSILFSFFLLVSFWSLCISGYQFPKNLQSCWNFWQRLAELWITSSKMSKALQLTISKVCSFSFFF